MKKNSEIKVTKFDNVKARSSKLVLLFDELRNIKNGIYRELVEQCRDALRNGNKEEYNILKSKLPAIAFSGEFKNGHKSTDLITYNNLIVIDIDGIYENLESLKHQLSNDAYILSLWLSPSGHGLKGLIKNGHNVENHKFAFSSIRKYFFENYNIELDASGSDVSRLCFCSWDENIMYNPSANTYTDLLIEENKTVAEKKRPNIDKALTKSAFATEGLNKPADRHIMKKIIKYLTRRNISITSNHSCWIKVALAISYTFSYDVGETYFLELCRLDNDKHDEVASVNLLKYCYNKRRLNTPSTISFASLIYLASEKGFAI